MANNRLTVAKNRIFISMAKIFHRVSTLIFQNKSNRRKAHGPIFELNVMVLAFVDMPAGFRQKKPFVTLSCTMAEFVLLLAR